MSPLAKGAASPAQLRGRVLFFISNMGLGGAESQLFHLAMGLKARGWQVEVATLSPLVHEPFAAEFARTGIGLVVLQKSMRAQSGSLLRALKAALYLLKSSRPNAVVGFMPHGAVFARVLGRCAGVQRTITSLRSVKSTRGWHDRLLAATRALDHAAVANSAAAAQAQIQAGVIGEDNSAIIYNGYHPDLFVDQRCQRSHKDQLFTWLNVAVFRAEKGHEILLRAAKIALDHHPFRLRLAGEGPELEKMQLLSADLKLQETVEFLGKRTDVPYLLSRCDGFVLPSLWEGLPNALIEALGSGIPAVATGVGGTPEVLKHEVAGLLVDAGDPEALAEAMVRLMKMQDSQRRRMGEEGRLHVASQFSMEQMLCKWEKVISGEWNNPAHPSQG
jgi:glycosyltransferase involved in cell wall biosynthesis